MLELILIASVSFGVFCGLKVYNLYYKEPRSPQIELLPLKEQCPVHLRNNCFYFSSKYCDMEDCHILQDHRQAEAIAKQYPELSEKYDKESTK